MIFFSKIKKKRLLTKHLNEMELSTYLEGLCHSETKLNEEISAHLEICLECKKKVILLIEIMRVA